MKRRAKAGPTPIETVKHKDKRANIPTEELRDFVVGDESGPATRLYPRDSSLDPQLVWKGKDEQDTHDLVVPVVPVYIQEKIHPKALIENLRDTAGGGAEEPELRLFEDFNGLDFERAVDFYQHEHSWTNRMILGDSLLVMTSLGEKEGLRGKVQMIYMDPPYGIKFGSNWQVSTRKRDVKDGRAEDATRQPEQIKAFRDTWELGIHSYLSYMRDRLVAARDLLTESGSIFVQIGDENVHLVRSLMDEVMGAENFVCQVIFTKTGGMSASLLGGVYDILLWYGKSTYHTKYRQLHQPKRLGGPGSSGYTLVEEPTGQWRPMTNQERSDRESLLPDLRVFDGTPLISAGTSSGGPQTFQFAGRTFVTPSNAHWKTHEQGLKRLALASRIVQVGNRLEYKRFFDDFPYIPLDNIWTGMGERGFTGKPIYVTQTDARVIQRCIVMATDPGDLVLDPTCGSGSTAYVAEQWGRRWITVDTSRVALALARTRLMSARYPYYLLADSPEGLAKQAAIDGGPVDSSVHTTHDVKRGFVYKTVPHVTLKSIANNPDIVEDMSRDEIDAAIARHADKEVLYDRPYEDSKRVRVTGPFTVESLSPHRTISEDEPRPVMETADIAHDAGNFEATILDNLCKAGVQNTVAGERLSFERLESYAGRFIHAEGEYTDSRDQNRRVAVSIGPEHGTVSPQQVQAAAKEAVKGVGFDVLVVCGFAFDPHVAEEVKRYGKLTVLPARMNPDLAMGDELLKKTGAGNLFMVFGEPDLAVHRSNGKVEVEINGLDVYDPTTGAIRSSSTDDIACWFVDTNYNDESFFVRHAYFTGADKPYERLKRALKADIDEAAWESLYATRSRAFDSPATGKIAVKVINHYGDEILKVYEV